jgi:hypothetical protein
MKTKPETLNNLLALTGRTGLYRFEGRGRDNQAFMVPVSILGVRQSYGRTEVRVKHRDALGEAWVAINTVELNPA